MLHLTAMTPMMIIIFSGSLGTYKFVAAYLLLLMKTNRFMLLPALTCSRQSSHQDDHISLILLFF